MCARHQAKPVVVIELFTDIVAEGVSSSSRWDTPAGSAISNSTKSISKVGSKTNLSSGSDQSKSHMGPSWGTSWMRSRERMWSRVSREGERPPCRQKIYGIKLAGGDACDLAIVKEMKVIEGSSPGFRQGLSVEDNQRDQWSTSTHLVNRISSSIHRRNHKPEQSWWNTKIKGTYLGDLSRFMVSTKNCDTVAVAKF